MWFDAKTNVRSLSIDFGLAVAASTPTKQLLVVGTNFVQ